MSIITDILKEIPLSSVLKERLTDAEAKMSALEKENVNKDILIEALKLQNGNLSSDLQKAREEIKRFKQEPTVAMVIPKRFDD